MNWHLGKEVTLLEYDGEGHVLDKRANIVDFWTRVIDFFDQKLGVTRK